MHSCAHAHTVVPNPKHRKWPCRGELHYFFQNTLYSLQLYRQYRIHSVQESCTHSHVLHKHVERCIWASSGIECSFWKLLTPSVNPDSHIIRVSAHFPMVWSQGTTTQKGTVSSRDPGFLHYCSHVGLVQMEVAQTLPKRDMGQRVHSLYLPSLVTKIAPSNWWERGLLEMCWCVYEWLPYFFLQLQWNQPNLG